MKPVVSVIIPNYNYARYLPEAVDSVLAQTYSNIEIIVVDDGSRDDSAGVIEGFAGSVIAIMQKNQGVSIARNNGVSKSTGDFLAFLDADDIWMPTKIEKQVKLFLEDRDLGLVHVGVLDIDDNGQPLVEKTNGMSGWVSDELLKFERSVILGGGSGIMISRKAFDEVGGFDTRMSTSADWDVFYQISSRYKVGFVPEILLKYRIHGSNMHGNIRAMEHDMMLGYRKAFETGAVTANKRESYSALHRVLSGSYFQAGQYVSCLRHAAMSVWNRPANIAYFADYPKRALNRKGTLKA